MDPLPATVRWQQDFPRDEGGGTRRGAGVRPRNGSQTGAFHGIAAGESPVQEAADVRVARTVGVHHRCGRDGRRDMVRGGAAVPGHYVGAARARRGDHGVGAALAEDLPHQGEGAFARARRTEEDEVGAEREFPVVVGQSVPVVQVRGDGDTEFRDVVVEEAREIHDGQVYVAGTPQPRQVEIPGHSQVGRVTGVVERHPASGRVDQIHGATGARCGNQRGELHVPRRQSLAHLGAGPVVADAVEECDLQPERPGTECHVPSGVAWPFLDRPDMDRVGERDGQGVDPHDGVHPAASDHQDVVLRVLSGHRRAFLFPWRPSMPWAGAAHAAAYHHGCDHPSATSRQSWSPPWKSPFLNGAFIDVLAGQTDRTGVKRMTPRLGLPNQHIVGLT